MMEYYPSRILNEMSQILFIFLQSSVGKKALN